MNLDIIDAAPEADARAALLRCCGARRWADAMLARRPFGTPADLLAAADDCFDALGQADWLEAFAAHPRIGDLDGLRQKFAATADWSSKEQAGVADAAEQVLSDLAAGNKEYEARFGHIFIVCATGKTAAEMLALLRARLLNAPDAELRIAAAEQAKITRLRLEKL
jgi:2-oxo-4-hydroxy-4-carboxy-5-ureidoimidazoline decarboxylase